MRNDVKQTPSINNSYARAIETGIWWEEEWWLDQEYQQKVSKTEIIENINALKRHFPPSWVLKSLAKKGPNAILPRILGGQGRLPFSSLMLTGAMVRRLEHASGFDKKVNELSSDKSHSIYFEMLAAEVFAQSNYSIEFVSESKKKKSHDVLMKKNEYSFAMECKCLESMAWEKWGQELTGSMMDLLSGRNISKQLQVQIELDPGIAELRMSDEQRFTKAIENGIRREIAASIKYLSGMLGEHTIPGIATVRVLPSTANEHGYISGLPISPHSKMKHILQNGVFRAIKQLPSTHPGIISIYCDFPPMPELMRLVLDSGIEDHKDRFASLAAIMLFPIQPFNANIPRMLYINNNSNIKERILKETIEICTTNGTFMQIND